jgi:hypothetical protein
MNRTATDGYHDTGKSPDDTYDAECILLLRRLFREALTANEDLTLDRYIFLQRYPLQ